MPLFKGKMHKKLVTNEELIFLLRLMKYNCKMLTEEYTIKIQINIYLRCSKNMYQ